MDINNSYGEKKGLGDLKSRDFCRARSDEVEQRHREKEPSSQKSGTDRGLEPLGESSSAMSPQNIEHTKREEIALQHNIALFYGECRNNLDSVNSQRYQRGLKPWEDFEKKCKDNDHEISPDSSDILKRYGFINDQGKLNPGVVEAYRRYMFLDTNQKEHLEQKEFYKIEDTIAKLYYESNSSHIEKIIKFRTALQRGFSDRRWEQFSANNGGISTNEYNLEKDQRYGAAWSDLSKKCEDNNHEISLESRKILKQYRLINDRGELRPGVKDAFGEHRFLPKRQSIV